mmetsp:Transcript_38574/g.56717  ORF Transcript_38574/g.56717 Transcript_38574/m.56717 type:complete len:104 (+) Transcript_38574:315-626(+)
MRMVSDSQDGMWQASSRQQRGLKLQKKNYRTGMRYSNVLKVTYSHLSGQSFPYLLKLDLKQKEMPWSAVSSNWQQSWRFSALICLMIWSHYQLEKLKRKENKG